MALFRPSRLSQAAAHAQRGEIDPSASVQAVATQVTSASPSSVWRVLVGIENWPDFMPSVSEVSIAQSPAPGLGFTWRNHGIHLRSTIQMAKPTEMLAWSGQAMWLTASHINQICELPTGETQLTSSESLTGFAASLLMPSQSLTKQLETFVRCVISRAETM